MQDTDLMLHTLLELGESMLADGADVRRVEQTLSRMGKAYGAVRMDVFVITSSIVLTMCFADGSAADQSKPRIEANYLNDKLHGYYMEYMILNGQRKPRIERTYDKGIIIEETT